MSKRIIKMWIVGISAVLLTLCCFIGASSMLGASAEETVVEQTQVYEDELQQEDVKALTLEEKDSSGDSSEYVNLGNTRLSEGDQGLTQIHYIENASA